MNETEAERLLHRVRDGIPIRPVPTEQLVDAGRRVRRRRRAGQVAGVVATVVALLAGGLLLRPEVTATPDVVGPPTPVAPDGTRLVGMGRVVVAVPADWATNAVRCGQPVRDTVAFASEGQRGCLVPGASERSWLQVVPSESTHAEGWLNAAGRTTTYDGVPVRRIDGDCEMSMPGVCSGALVAETQDVVMVASSSKPTVVESVLDSVRVLPDGWTTVPYDPNGPVANTVAWMEDVGLTVEVTYEERPGLSNGVLLAADPELASVTEAGSTVELRVSRSEPGKGERVIQVLAAEQTPDGGLFAIVPTCQEDARLDVVETEEVVAVTAYTRADIDFGCTYPVPIELKVPVGGRVVQDGSTGELVPTSPEAQPHQFSLLTHCGIEFAHFVGQWWSTKPRSDGSGNPPRGWDNPAQRGTMTLVDQDTAVFISAGRPPLTFEPTDAEPPLCG